MASSGYQDVDVVLTSRELGRMIPNEAGIDLQIFLMRSMIPPMGYFHRRSCDFWRDRRGDGGCTQDRSMK